MRTEKTYTASIPEPNLSGLDGPVAFLNSNTPEASSYLAVGALDYLEVGSPGHAFSALQAFHDRTRDWVFGHMSYDLKDEAEALTSSGADAIEAPVLYFFQPVVVFELEAGRIRAFFHAGQTTETEVDNLVQQLREPVPADQGYGETVVPRPRMDKEVYLNKVRALQEHIQQGDIYEVNFCQEFLAPEADIDPWAVYARMNQLSRAPFSAYYAFNDIRLMSGSPERFLKKSGQTVLSQPIKGTIGRGVTPEEDRRLQEKLQHDPKERAENIMIVDLVRNDLSRHARKGSVRVEELCEVYTFPTVHQLISTVAAELREEATFTEVIRDAFPMGSMTGAPKVRAMELIDRYELSRRGIYSGAVGYIRPNGDFDLNVVIRSLLYNTRNRNLSYTVGGAITSRSEPEQEYEECLLKASALQEALRLPRAAGLPSDP